ncbi:hypothetical protein FACS189435_3040 [Bacteroidia bacterium]|nr:hypothetical protein FACS189435_3040 [Bacteroidia bacterium]
MRRARLFIAAFSFIVLISAQGFAQKKAEISADILTYDFGIIPEAEEGATHVFPIKNTGTAPLIINNVSASCGCTRPEWPKAPIEPGATGEVKINYSSKGRPGPFYKSIVINSNARNNRFSLYIKGTVSIRQASSQPAIVYPYHVGDLKLETKNVLYSRIYPGEKLEEVIRIKNEGTAALNLQADRTPDYLSVECNPKLLKPGETGEISVLFQTAAIKRMGHIATSFHLIVESVGKKKEEGAITVTANIIDNFTHMPAADKAKAPVAQYSRIHLDFGKLPEKSGGIIPFIGGSGKSESLKITNTGHSTLLIYSITCDNELIDISGGRKEIKPGASAEYKISIHSKAVKAKLEDYIHIVSNDPNGPVRLIKVTAEK